MLDDNNVSVRTKLAEINSHLSSLKSVKNFSAGTSHVVGSWSNFYIGLIIGFMADYGGFMGYIAGTTYTSLCGDSIGSRLSLSIASSSPHNLIISCDKAVNFTFISSAAL